MAPSNPNPPPRTLNVKKFAESRSRELESLHSVISDRLNRDFKIHRSKRRRTTGYRSSKRKIRKATGSGPDSNPNPKTTRRGRRRLELQSNPDSGFVTSGDGTRRLRTHLWHAKRFTMVKRWGFHLPLGVQGRGRGSRAILKWLKFGALVHDASYCHPIQLEGPEESISAILGMVLLSLPSCVSEEMSRSIKYGVCYNNAALYHVGTPLSQFISPVLYMWRPFVNRKNHVNAEQDHVSSGCCDSAKQESNTSRQLWIWIHAAAFEEGFGALRTACQKQMHESGVSVSCVSLEGQIAKLEIMGSKATQILQKMLHPVPEAKSGSGQKTFVLQHAEHAPSQAILSLIVSDPRDLPPMETETDLEATIHGSNLQENDIQTFNHVIFGNSAESEDGIRSLWSEPASNGVFLSDCRHLWDSSEKVNPPVPENILCTDRHRKRLELFNFDPINDEKSALFNFDPVNDEKSAQDARDGFGQSCPILLLKHPNRGNLNTICSIVLPLNWVKIFWISLVSHGAHAIGLRERRWIACDSELPCFPYDFPDCKAYSLLMAAEAAAFDNSAELRPPAVRPPRVPIPPPWECIESTCKYAGVQPCADVGPTTSSSSEQPATSFIGFIPRNSNALSEYWEKIRDTSIDRMHDARGLCLVRVLLRACKEGVFEDGAVVCAPILADLPRWESRSEEEGALQIPQSLIQSYFTRQDSGTWKLQLPNSCSNPESYRWPVGFVTTGFVRGSKKPTAVGFCEAKLLAQLREQQSRQTVQGEARAEIRLFVRNLRSAAYRRALATIALEEEREDTEFM